VDAEMQDLKKVGAEDREPWRRRRRRTEMPGRGGLRYLEAED